MENFRFCIFAVFCCLLSVVVSGANLKYATAKELATKRIIDRGDYLDVCTDIMELGVVFDVSRSIRMRDFSKVKKILLDYLGKYTVAQHAVRVAFLPFETEAHPKEGFNLDTYKSLPQMATHVNALKHLGYWRRRGKITTNTHLAIRYMRTKQLSRDVTRQGVPRVALVLTDGNSNRRKLTKMEAEKATADGIDVWAVGYGSRISMKELRNIASDPSKAALASDLKGLEKVLSQLAVKCEKRMKPTTPKPKFPMCTSSEVTVAYSQRQLSAELNQKVLTAISTIAQYPDYKNSLKWGVRSAVCPVDQGFGAVGSGGLNAALGTLQGDHLSAVVQSAVSGGVFASAPPRRGGVGLCNAAILVVGPGGAAGVNAQVKGLRDAGVQDILVWNLSGGAVDVEGAQVSTSLSVLSMNGLLSGHKEMVY